jgi:hypothetical protein
MLRGDVGLVGKAFNQALFDPGGIAASIAVQVAYQLTTMLDKRSTIEGSLILAI